MYRFTRTVTAKNAGAMVAGLQFAAEVAAYLNKKYSLNMKYGAELFGTPTLHWHFESDSVDKMLQINAKLMQDKEYVALLDKHKEGWVPGSLKDTLVALGD